jgi:hypothetical protein
MAPKDRSTTAARTLKAAWRRSTRSLIRYHASGWMAVAVAAYSMTPPMTQNQSCRTIDDFDSRLRLTKVQTAANSITIEWNGATTRLKVFGSSSVRVRIRLARTTSGIAAFSARLAALLGCHRASAQISVALRRGCPAYPIQRLLIALEASVIATTS